MGDEEPRHVLRQEVLMHQRSSLNMAPVSNLACSNRREALLATWPVLTLASTIWLLGLVLRMGHPPPRVMVLNTPVRDFRLQLQLATVPMRWLRISLSLILGTQPQLQ